MAFTKKRIELTFQLGQGNFGLSGFNTVTVKGLRVSCKIVKTGAAAFNTCEMRVFGLSPTIYNSLTSIYQVTQNVVMKNIVTVNAGDAPEGATLPQVFSGQITICQIDLNNQPEAVLTVIAQQGLLQSLAPVAPSSYPTGCNVATALSGLANTMGVTFQNYGVTTVLPKSYFPGTARQQALAIIRSAGINWNNMDGGVLAIWPKGGNIGGAIPVLSPTTGMVGYPSYSNIGVGAKCEFNPNIVYGGQVKIESSISQTQGVWNVYGLSHTLESEFPGGAWFTEIQGSVI